MAAFEMITNPPAHLIPQAVAITRQYFTIDTATTDTIMDWFGFNRHIVTYAMHDGKVRGYFNVLPLNVEAGKLFEAQEIREEDLTVDHMLPHELMPHARYAYVPAIAVDRTQSFVSRQCSAALLACMADLFQNGYGANLKRIFVNPTTFQGNKLVGRLGLKPVIAHKKSLKANDIYVAEMNRDTRRDLAGLSQRYTHFIKGNPWTKAG